MNAYKVPPKYWSSCIIPWKSQTFILSSVHLTLFWVGCRSLTQKVSDDVGLALSLTQLGKESSGSSEGINWNKAKNKKKLTDSPDSSVFMTVDDTLPFCWNDDILFAMVPVFRILESQYSRIWKNSYDPHKRKFQNSQYIFSDGSRARGKGKSAFSTQSSCFTAFLLKRQWVQSKGWWITSNNSPSSFQCVQQRVV